MLFLLSVSPLFQIDNFFLRKGEMPLFLVLFTKIFLNQVLEDGRWDVYRCCFLHDQVDLVWTSFYLCVALMQRARGLGVVSTCLYTCVELVRCRAHVLRDCRIVDSALESKDRLQR